MPNSSFLSDLVGHQRQIDPDNMTYEELLRLGEEVGDVKKERWQRMAVQVLSSLPTHRWTRGQGEETYVLQYWLEAFIDLVTLELTCAYYCAISCIICQYNFVPDDRAMTLPCAHVFHEGRIFSSYDLYNWSMVLIY